MGNDKTLSKRYSQLLSKKALEDADSPKNILQNINTSINELLDLWDNENNPQLIEIIKILKTKMIFKLPEIFNSILNIDKTFDDKAKDNEIMAWANALNCRFSEFEAYENYITDKSSFGPHQGVKGLEFNKISTFGDKSQISRYFQTGR